MQQYRIMLKLGDISKEVCTPLYLILDSIVVSIPACHAGDRGSIPRRGGLFVNICRFFELFFLISYATIEPVFLSFLFFNFLPFYRATKNSAKRQSNIQWRHLLKILKFELIFFSGTWTSVVKKIFLTDVKKFY
jgi:hypothetical protein